MFLQQPRVGVAVVVLLELGNLLGGCGHLLILMGCRLAVLLRKPVQLGLMGGRRLVPLRRQSAHLCLKPVTVRHGLVALSAGLV